MIRGFLLLSIGASLYAGSEYVPFSKFSQTEQVEYNFKKAEIKADEKIEQVKQIKKVSIRNYKKPTQTNIIKKEEIRKPIAQKITKSKEVVKKTKYKQDILYSARLTYSPLTAEHSTATTSDSNKSNSIEPSGSVSFGDHKVEASYFKSENDFNSSSIDTSW